MKKLVVALSLVVVAACGKEDARTPSQALVADATPPEDRPVAFGLLFAALAAAGMVAGLLAAVLAGIDLRWLFVADAVTCLACAGIVWWRLALEGRSVDDLTAELTASLEPRGRLEIDLRDGEVIVTLGADEVPGCLHALVDLEKRLSLTVTGLRIERPSLETLFLSLTGRELRDGE